MNHGQLGVMNVPEEKHNIAQGQYKGGCVCGNLT